MIEAFVDSYFWLAAVNPQDPYHNQVVQTPRPARAVTTRHVLIEVMDALCAPRFRQLAGKVWQTVESDPDVIVVESERHLLDRAVALFAARQDKAWSLTD